MVFILVYLNFQPFLKFEKSNLNPFSLWAESARPISSSLSPPSLGPLHLAGCPCFTPGWDGGLCKLNELGYVKTMFYYCLYVIIVVNYAFNLFIVIKWKCPLYAKQARIAPSFVISLHLYIALCVHNLLSTLYTYSCYIKCFPVEDHINTAMVIADYYLEGHCGLLPRGSWRT